MPLFGPNITKLAEKKDVEGLLKCVENDKLDGPTRYSAAKELANLSDERAVPYLLYVYDRCESGYDRATAFEIINTLGQLSKSLGIDLYSLSPQMFDFGLIFNDKWLDFICNEFKKYVNADFVNNLVVTRKIENILREESTKYEKAQGYDIVNVGSFFHFAPTRIAKMGNIAVQPLLRYLSPEKPANEKKIVILALGKLKTPDAIKPLTSLLEDSQKNYFDTLDLFIMVALSEIGGEQCVNILRERVLKRGDIDFIRYYTAIILIDRLGYKNSDIWLSLINDGLASASSGLFSYANSIIENLEKTGWRPEYDEIGVFYFIIKRGNTIINKEKVIEMGEEAVPVLIRLLSNSGENSRRAAEILAEIGDSRAVKPLETWFGWRANVSFLAEGRPVLETLLKSQALNKTDRDELTALLEITEGVQGWKNSYGIDGTGRWDPQQVINRSIGKLSQSSNLILEIIRISSKEEYTYTKADEAVNKACSLTDPIAYVVTGKRIIRSEKEIDIERPPQHDNVTIATDGNKYYVFKDK